MFELLERLNAEGKTVVYVTHDRDLARRASQRSSRSATASSWTIWEDDVLSAELRKSVTDLTRRRARTAFTVATLALAVASVSFLAIPSVIDASMQDEVRAESLADATVTMRPLRLTDAQLAELAALPNVAAIEPGIRVNGRVLVGERRAPALVIGVRDFARQSVDVVRLAAGAYPGPGEVLTDVQNANVGVYDGRPGERAQSRGRGRPAHHGRGAATSREARRFRTST